jgi:hypothetical protein
MFIACTDYVCYGVLLWIPLHMVIVDICNDLPSYYSVKIRVYCITTNIPSMGRKQLIDQALTINLILIQWHTTCTEPIAWSLMDWHLHMYLELLCSSLQCALYLLPHLSSHGRNTHMTTFTSDRYLGVDDKGERRVEANTRVTCKGKPQVQLPHDPGDLFLWPQYSNNALECLVW